MKHRIKRVRGKRGDYWRGRKRGPISEEHRQKLIKAQKGHVCYTLGRKHTKEEKINLSKKLKGRKKPEGFGEKISLANLGEKHPNWKGGRSFGNYSKYFNPRFRRLIRKRDNYLCVMCGIHSEKLNRALDVHHINYDKKFTIPENCISLCDNCHRKTNINKKQWISFFQSILSKKYGYIYENQRVIVNLELKGGM